METRAKEKSELNLLKEKFAERRQAYIELPIAGFKTVKLETSPDALSPFGAAFLERRKLHVTSTNKKCCATIVGVAVAKDEKQLWFIIDDETTAMYCSSIRCKKTFDDRATKLNPADSHADFAHPALKDYLTKASKKEKTEKNKSDSRTQKIINSIKFLKPVSHHYAQMSDDDFGANLVSINQTSKDNLPTKQKKNP